MGSLGFGDRGGKIVNLNDNCVLLTTETVYKLLAIETCIDVITNALVQADFQILSNGEIKKEKMHYKLNVAPNIKQSSVEFYKELFRTFFLDGEVLVVQIDEDFRIASNFTREENDLGEDKFTSVMILDTEVKQSFMESEVLYFKQTDANIIGLVDGFFKSYGKLITASQNVYKRSNAKRYVMKGDFLRSQTNKNQTNINEMMNSQFKGFLEADSAGAIFQMQDSYNLEDMSGGGKSGMASTSTRDIRALVNDIFEIVATVFHVPRGLLNGDTAMLSEQVDSLLMLGVKPHLKMFEGKYNQTMYTIDEYQKGNRLKIETSSIKIVDVTKVANAVDKLLAVGAWSVNDIRIYLGQEPINEPWANEHYVTKNYVSVNNPEPEGSQEL